jgi:hypothetical protein
VAIQAVIARAVGTTRVEYRQLPFKTDRRAADQRPGGRYACSVNRFASRKIVRTIQYQIDVAYCRVKRIGIQRAAVRDQFHFRVDRDKPGDGRIDLGLTDAQAVMDDLALQVSQIDAVEIRQMHLADARSGQIQRHRRTEATQADDQYTTVFEPQLPVDIHVVQQDLPAVAQQLLIAQHGSCPKLMRSCSPRSRRV